MRIREKFDEWAKDPIIGLLLEELGMIFICLVFMVVIKIILGG